MLKIINVAGARPNFMKIAPLVRAMSRHSDICSILCHTGQHYDENLSKVFFDDLDIPRPDVDLGVGSGTRDEQITRISQAFEPVVGREMPDLVLVVGDVNSTIACARVAKTFGVRVAHVEAGLRSFDLTMPEEHNRRETDEVSDYLFVTEPSGTDNLVREGVKGKYFFVGNVMIDTLVQHLKRAQGSRILSELCLIPGEYVAGTFHRPSNVDTKGSLTRLMETISAICKKVKFVLPLHPRTRNSIRHFDMLGSLDGINGLIVTEPLGYLDFLKLVSEARAVVTDSGGIQEETTYLGIPCITMRDNTERPVTIEVGTNVLVGSDQQKVLTEVDQALDGQRRPRRIPDLWDGSAASRIVDILRRELLT